MYKKKLILAWVLILIVFFISIIFYKNIYPGIAPIVKESESSIEELIPDSKSKNEKSVPLSDDKTEGQLKVPQNFSISLWARGLERPRVLIQDSLGTILVSDMSKGQVLALPDKNYDRVVDEVIVIASGLKRPHGLELKCETDCKLYVAESNQIVYFDYNPVELSAENKEVLLRLSDSGRHYTKTLLKNPKNDDQLLIASGSSCNVCHEKDFTRGSIMSFPFDGDGELKLFSTGLRNAVFMTHQPETNEVWVTEMGVDWLGDDLPPDEINKIEEGKDYGWPECFGKNVRDTSFEKFGKNPCYEPNKIASEIDIQAHSAPLGLAFIPANSDWPDEYWNDLLVAYHGSWNRSVPTGYKVVRLKMDSNGVFLGEEDFVSGWLSEGDKEIGAYGRPAGILVKSDGRVFISDDKAGLIYQVEYKK